MLRLLVFVFVLTLSVIAQLRAEEVQGNASATSAPLPSFSSLKANSVAIKVLKVIDPVTILGDNKTVYTLTGIDVPGLAGGDPALLAAAQKALTKLIEGKSILIYQTQREDTGRINRLGHSLVQAVTVQGHQWVQGYLLMSGLARVRITASNPEMATDMLNLENKARLDKKGLWALPGYAPRLASSMQTNHSSEDGFQIVEGKIHSVALNKNQIFINFGQDWRQDFTVGISPTVRRAFAKRNIDPLQLGGAVVRVRGWVRDYNGPYMELDHPAHLELISGKMGAPISPIPAQDNSGQNSPPPSSDPAIPDSPEPNENEEQNLGMKSIHHPVAPAVAQPAPPKPVAEPPAPQKQKEGEQENDEQKGEPTGDRP